MNIQTIIDKIKCDEILNNLTSFFDNEIYLVGGAVRDFLSDNEIFDRDLIVTDEDAGVFARKVADFFGGVFIPLDEENKIYRVVLSDKQNYLDITNPAGSSLVKDLTRRDLTINAVAINIRSGEIVDLFGGIEDFQNRIIRGICDENFIDDPLRMLRIFRFHSVLGFDIDDSLVSVVRNNSELVLKPAKERVEYELMKLFNGLYVPQALLKMDESQVLELLFPFVRELKRVPPNAHHHLDLFNHSIETIRQLDILFENSCDEVKNHLFTAFSGVRMTTSAPYSILVSSIHSSTSNTLSKQSVNGFTVLNTSKPNPFSTLLKCMGMAIRGFILLISSAAFTPSIV